MADPPDPSKAMQVLKRFEPDVKRKRGTKNKKGLIEKSRRDDCKGKRAALSDVPTGLRCFYRFISRRFCAGNLSLINDAGHSSGTLVALAKFRALSSILSGI
jgi:hypothetical protein